MLGRRIAVVVVLTLCGCAAQSTQSGKGAGVTFQPEQLAKTDIDRVAEAHQRELLGSLRVIAEKLYRRNPREWKKGGQSSIEAALAHIFDVQHEWRFAELDNKRGTDALSLAFREDFRGDRVLALVVGLGGMIRAAFNEKTEFFVLDELEPQKLYNSARNVELAVWKLSNARDAQGNAYLVSNEMGTLRNLSFEREFGKIIGNLDLLSKILADKQNRTVVRIVQSLATAVFLPIK